MDDQPIVSRSLQYELTRWIVIATLSICTFAGIVTGLLAYFEAKDIQDEVLLQIAHLIGDVDNIDSASYKLDDKDSNIIVDSLAEDNRLSVAADHPEGFTTIQANNESWRVVVHTKPDRQRVLVAQQTELIHEAALANLFSAILPIALLAIVLIGLTHWIIARRMKSIMLLANAADKQTVNNLNLLATDSVPKEILPFIEAINRLLQRTKETIERQRRFIADASHELRTPVTALTLLAENIENAKSTSEQEKRQQLLRQGLDRLNNLINQLLSLTRLQNLQSNEIQSVRLDEIVKRVVVLLHPLAEEKSIDLGLVATSAVTVQAIEGRLQQLIENAIANAIYYTPEGGEIDVSVSVVNHIAEFVVEDSGPGIAEQEIEKVFTPFYRSKEQTIPGSGLGLAICAEIAKQHQAVIKLENRRQGGLRFIYRHPIRD